MTAPARAFRRVTVATCMLDEIDGAGQKAEKSLDPITAAPTTPITLAGRDPAIIGLCGLAGSGKDTAAAHLVSVHGFEALAFADPINDALAVLLDSFGVDHTVLHERALKEQPLAGVPGQPSPRELKQRLGDAFRAVDADWFVLDLAHRAGLNDLPRSAPVHDRIVITDVRYPNEAALVRRLGGVLIHLQRDAAAPVRAHDSEAWAALLDADISLVNNGLTPHCLYALLNGAVHSLGLYES